MSMRLGGLITGMDTQSIVQQLMQAESQPLYQMQSKQHKLNLKKDLFSEVSSSLTGLQSKIQNLFKKSTFDPLKVSTSDDTKIKANLGSNAMAGIYSLDVTTLATATTLTGKTLNAAADTKALVSSTSVVSSGGLTVDTTKKFSEQNFANVLPGNDTLKINGVSFTYTNTMTVDTLMNQINSSSAGVVMLYDSTSDTFSLQSKESGSNAKVEISDSNGFFSKINIAKGTYKGDGTADLSAKLRDSKIDGIASAGGVFYFKINDYSFNFSEDTSLQTVLDTINKSGAGVVSFYDSKTDKITITNKDTGNKYIKFEDKQGNFLESLGVYDSVAADHGQSLQDATLGKNAEFELNGASMVRESNSFTINGIDFTLQSTGTSSVNVDRDEDSIYKSIKDFVDQYNSTVNLLSVRLSESTVKDATSDAMMSKGMLRSESSIMNISSSIREVATRTVSGISNLYSSLADIGITTDSADYGKSGKLVIDDTKLKDAIKNNPESVQKLFFADQNDNEKVDSGELGVAADLYNKIQQYVDTKTINVGGRSVKAGILANEIDSLSQQSTDYDKSIEDFNTRLKDVEQRYWNQFNAMEEAISKLNDQGSWLSAQLSGM